jgi:hypothetical protein
VIGAGTAAGSGAGGETGAGDVAGVGVELELEELELEADELKFSLVNLKPCLKRHPPSLFALLLTPLTTNPPLHPTTSQYLRFLLCF